MKWVVNDPARFLHERAELGRLEHEVDWLATTWRIDTNGSVEVDFNIMVHGHTYTGRMTYPDVFPNSPPHICPLDPSERWTIHQYGAGGSLCLEWRADNWQTHVTGADIIKSAFDLLSAENHPVKSVSVPSAHCVTEGQSMRNETNRFVVTNELIQTLLALPQHTKATLKSHTILHNTATIGFVSEISTNESSVTTITDLPVGISTYLPLFAYKGDGWVFKSETFIPGATIDSPDDLLDMLAEFGLHSDDLLVKKEGSNNFSEKMVILFAHELTSIRIFLIKPREQAAISEYKVIMPSDSDPRLPKECEQLSSVRVGIVGLGSIGSKVAVSLARSGIRRFLLVDDDYLVPGNLVRHDLSWTSVGVHKVNAVRDALKLVAAEVDVDVQIHRVAGQESALSAATVLKDLANCDLLIDATANPEVFLRIAAVAKVNKKPMCWGELFASGCGGLIARARPDLDPNPLAIRSAIHSHLATVPPAPFQQTSGYDIEQEQPLIAYDSDVGQIAALLTRISIDTALQNVPSQFPHPVYLIGMRKEWIFEQPFDTRPIAPQGEGWDGATGVVTEEERMAALKEVLEIYGETRRVESDSTL